MSPTTIYARTAITATAHPARHGWQHKDRRGQASRLDCLTAPIAPWQQSNKFLATNVTKKLDHYILYILRTKR